MATAFAKHLSVRRSISRASAQTSTQTDATLFLTRFAPIEVSTMRVASDLGDADRMRDVAKQCGLALFDRGLAFAVIGDTVSSKRDMKAAIKLFPELATRAQW
jgi:hypothetical protein